MTFLQALLLFPLLVNAQDKALINVQARQTISLNGKWQYLMDPYESGVYDLRFTDRRSKDHGAFYNTNVLADTARQEIADHIRKNSLTVPGDWNSQDPKLLYYEGVIWYFRSFDHLKIRKDRQLYLYFGAVNYQADVYLNGQKLGTHAGGFTPFNFPVPDPLLRERGNFLVVRVNNKRMSDHVPALSPDWWNYGGITRDVLLIEEPKIHIKDYFIALDKNTPYQVNGWIKMSAAGIKTVTVDIPELKIRHQVKLEADSGRFTFRAPGLRPWSPAHPKLYSVRWTSPAQSLSEKIGFRQIRVDGQQFLLNEEPVFFRGICIQEEMPAAGRRAYSKADALFLLEQAVELGANFVRLAHYPHNEHTLHVADSLGLMVWSEIPVFQKIDFKSTKAYTQAVQQLDEMITRDKNRSSIVVWSVGNETSVGPDRNVFMRRLIASARALDSTRAISSALEAHHRDGTFVINDPLGSDLDLLAVNEYLGWYNGSPKDIRSVKWDIRFSKPLIISETGAEALGGFHGDSTVHWTEEYQRWYFREQLSMMDRMPKNFIGVAPWILNDFRSPRRNLPILQDGWNNKGLYDRTRNKKLAFDVVSDYYRRKKAEHPIK